MKIKKLPKQHFYLLMFMAVYQVAYAYYAYQSVYLQDNGFSASQLGLLNTIAYVLGLVFTTLSGYLCDRLHSIKRVVIPVLIVGSLLYAEVPFISPSASSYITTIFILMPICSVFRTIGFRLTDNLLVRGCAVGGYNFGLTRGIGSLTYAAACLSCIFLVPKTGVKITFWCVGLFMIPTIYLIFKTNDPAVVVEKKQKLRLRELLEAKEYLILIVFVFFYFMCQTPEYDFLSVIMNDFGFNTDYFGLIVCYRAAMEFPMLFLADKLRKRFQLPNLLVAGSLFYAVECFVITRAVSTLPQLVMVMTLAGLGNGLLIAASGTYVISLVPENIQATAASVYSVVGSVGGMLGELICGNFIDLYGTRFSYDLLGICMVIACALFVGMRFLYKKNQEKKNA